MSSKGGDGAGGRRRCKFCEGEAVEDPLDHGPLGGAQVDGHRAVGGGTDSRAGKDCSAKSRILRRRPPDILCGRMQDPQLEIGDGDSNAVAGNALPDFEGPAVPSFCFAAVGLRALAIRRGPFSSPPSSAWTACSLRFLPAVGQRVSQVEALEHMWLSKRTVVCSSGARASRAGATIGVVVVEHLVARWRRQRGGVGQRSGDAANLERVHVARTSVAPQGAKEQVLAKNRSRVSVRRPPRTLPEFPVQDCT